MNVGSWQIDQLKVPEQFLKMSKAYMQSSRILCTRLIEHQEETSYERGCVVMYLTYHAVELFLKAAILHREPKANLHHVLEYLGQNYDRLYPEAEYRWSIPFNVEVLGYEPEEVERIKKQYLSKVPGDQIYRYPVNRKRTVWDGTFSFEAKGFLDEITKIELDFQRIEVLVFV